LLFESGCDDAQFLWSCWIVDVCDPRWQQGLLGPISGLRAPARCVLWPGLPSGLVASGCRPKPVLAADFGNAAQRLGTTTGMRVAPIADFCRKNKEMQFDEKALEEVRQSRLLMNQFDDWLFEEFKHYVGRRVLEIGCGLGNHFEHFLDKERLVGFDLSSDTVLKVQQQFAEKPNVRVLVASITDPGVLALREERFDTVFSLNVFEHIEDDQLALQHTCQLLQHGGTVILIVPAHQWLYGPMDLSIGHFRRYTKKMARQKLEQAGFQIETQKYINMLGAFGWLVNGRVFRRRVPPRGQLRLLNEIIPICRRIERHCPAPFGVSLLSVARRKASP
jgi:SAM-dependent methyltransferase